MVDKCPLMYPVHVLSDIGSPDITTWKMPNASNKGVVNTQMFLILVAQSRTCLFCSVRAEVSCLTYHDVFDTLWCTVINFTPDTSPRRSSTLGVSKQSLVHSLVNTLSKLLSYTKYIVLINSGTLPSV